jgi:hypothetical protein
LTEEQRYKTKTGLEEIRKIVTEMRDENERDIFYNLFFGLILEITAIIVMISIRNIDLSINWFITISIAILIITSLATTYLLWASWKKIQHRDGL